MALIAHRAPRGCDATAPPSPDLRLWWTVVAVGAVLRILVMPFGGYPTDIASFKAWAQMLAQAGPGTFYGRGFVDYLPGYLYVLWGIGEVHRAVRLNDAAFLFALKLPAAIADLVTAGLIRRVAARLATERIGLLLATLYVFHPAVVFTSAYWGQADSVGALAALGALLLMLEGRAAAWPLAGIAFLIKPQTAPLLLVMAVGWLRRALTRPGSGRAWAQVLVAAGLATAPILLLAAPFRLGPLALGRLLREAIDVYPYGSVVAFNLWGAVQGFWVTDGARWLGAPLAIYGMLAAGLALGAVFLPLWRRGDNRTIIVAAATAMVAAFLLPTRIHERYLLPSLPLLALGTAVDRRMAGPFAALSALLTLNLLYAYTRPHLQTFTLPGWLEATIFSGWGTRLLSAAAVLTLPWLLAVLWRRSGST